ncbi:MAG: hypothetical protein GY751_08000 [Bacteroidetes bacterium]|nr:hypothetical protein [Bacteroidota bacterium]
MRKLNFILISIITLSLMMTIFSSCGADDDECTDTAMDYNGTWVGRYKIFIIPIDENDTLVVTSSGNSVTLKSSLLGGSEFEAEYDPITGQIMIDTVKFDEFYFGNDTFFDITVSQGRASLTGDCETMFLNLTGVSVESGTVNLPSDFDYDDLNNVTLSTDNQHPLKKQ